MREGLSMKKVLVAAFAAVLMSSAAHASTLLFPTENPVAQITIPDSWKPHETDVGIEATSDDNAVYLALDVATSKTSDGVIDDAFAFLKKSGVSIDGKTQKRTDGKINDMDVAVFEWAGTDKDGPASIGVAVVSPKPDKLLVLTYWGSADSEAKHSPEVTDILQSLKPSK